MIDREKFRKNFGARIKALREKHKLSQLELGRRVGAKGNNRVANWESGENSCSLETVMKLSEVFNESPTYLLTGEKDISPLLTNYKSQISNLRKIQEAAINARNINEKLVSDLYEQIEYMEKNEEDKFLGKPTAP